MIAKTKSILAAAFLALWIVAPVIAATQSDELLNSSRRILQETETEKKPDQTPDQPNPLPQVPNSGGPEGEQINLDLIDDELANVEKAELDDAVKGTIRNHYLAARQFLAETNSETMLTNAYRNASLNAVKQRQLLQKAIGESEKAQPPLPQDLTVLEQKKIELEQLIERYQAELKLAIEEPQRRQARRLKLPSLISAAQSRLAEVQVQLTTDAPESENQLLTRARMVELRSEKQHLQQQQELYRVERDSYQATEGNLSLRESLAERALQEASQQLEMVVQSIGRLREEETERRLRESEDALDSSPEELDAMATYNLKLTERLVKTTGDLKDIKSLRVEGQRAVQQIEVEFEMMQSRVKAVGLTYEFGAMLRRNKSELMTRPPPLRYEDVDANLQDGQLRKFRWQDERAKLSDLPAELDKELSAMELTDKRRGEIRPAAKSLLESRRSVLEELEDAEVTLLGDLGDIKSLQQQHLTKSREYAEFLDERILWVRSEPALGIADEKGVTDLDVASEGLVWFLDPGNWKSVSQSIIRSAQLRLPIAALIMIGLLSLVLWQPRSRAELKQLAPIASKRGCREFSPTVSAFFHTVSLALFWPAIGLGFAWLITNEHQGMFTWAIGRGLAVTSLMLLSVEMLRCTCRKEGLALQHFGWSEGFRAVFRKHSGWYLLVSVPLLFVIVAIESSNISNFNRLGRIAMLGLLAASMLFFYRLFSVFRPGGAAFNREADGFDATVNRLRSLLFVTILGGFALLFLFAVLGYYESVYKIGTSLLQTLQLFVWTLIIFGMAMRFFLIRRRKLRFEQLVQQRKAAIAAAEKQAESGTSLASEALDIDLQAESGMDITDVSRQARELTGVIFLIVFVLSLLGIWQYLLPATKILDSWELWRITIGSEVEFVTARDLLLSLITFAITFFSVRNIPGMLELLLLQRLPLDAGARYAVASIFRYILLVVGVVIALGFLKIPWSNYSWLVAAISVGLGFGLQEIVANFVSGLILLLERPVRVGDVVTIDGVTGVVSRIQMRATTVTNWDNQELVVPNKDLISGKLLNWTLSSVINRIALRVGVAYGTDVGRVREIIAKIVDRHPDVLKDPAPIIIFEEFGDNSLNFAIRCCTSTIARRWHLIDEINSAINEAFEREGIEIPFPQRVMHMIEQHGGDADDPQ